MSEASVGVLKRADGRYLCVWNKRYGGWSFPGGRVEDGELAWYTLQREFREETGIESIVIDRLAYSGVHQTPSNAASDMRSRGSIVHVWVVTEVKGVPTEKEVGCPVTWLTREEFLKWTPFKAFYEPLFNDGILP